MMRSSVVFFLAVSFAVFGFGFGNNVAVGGNVTQSSVYDTAVPEKAIDGNHASNWFQGSCATTKADFKPWWRLDLLKSYKISNVTITNREDCCPERINGAEIRIGDSLNDNGNTNPRCAVISSIPAVTSKTFKCDMEGRYVNIVIPGRNEYLTLCEVEVYGDVVEDSVPSGELYHMR
ncbi:fucolectin-like [Centroberyx gerrardi]